MDNLLSILRNLGAVRIATLVVSVLLLVSLFALIMVRINQSPYSLLYGGLNESEAGRIAQTLDAMGSKYEVRAGGNLYVEADKVSELRLKIAGEGLVGSSNSGYELLDKGSSFGTTSLIQNVNVRRALEGELAKTIMALPMIKSARVHLVMPKQKLFSKEEINPTASVALNLGDRILSDEQIGSITHMVAASVPNLNPDNVTVIDQRGNMLSSGNKSVANVLGTHEKIRRQIEADYETSITRMLERIVGPNKANVKVTANMNFDSMVENSELYDPEKQVIRSEQRSENSLNSVSSNGNQSVGAASNIPGQEVGGGGAGSEENQSQIEETINYEISKTIRKYVREGGSVERLSVAVLVEGHHGQNEDGEMVYTPYSENDIEKMTTLVQTAIGYNQDRGDTVEIIDMAFTQIDEEEVFEEPLFTKEDYYKMAEIAAIFVGIFLLVFMIIKPILQAAIPEASSDIARAMGAGAVSQPITAQDGSVLTPEMIQAGLMPDGSPIPPEIFEASAMQGGANNANIPKTENSRVHLEKVEGTVKESVVKKAVEIVEQFPEESIGVIRSWMSGGESPES